MTSAERAAELFDRLNTPGFACVVVREVREIAKADDLKEISKAIDAAVAEALAARWVPVGERLPTPDTDVIVTRMINEHRVVSEATYRAPFDIDEPGTWWAGEWDIYNVVAWQPLPAAWVAP